MANETYINKGTALLINGEAGANYAWSIEGVANGAGRISAQIDLGAAPRAEWYEWSCETQFQATPTQYAGLELYLAFAPDHDATQIDGDSGQADAAVTDGDVRYNLVPIGVVVSENAAASEKCVRSGIFRATMRYVSIVGWNSSGAAINATDTVTRFDMRPVYNVPGA